MGMDLYDANVVVEIYNKCSSYEERYTKKLHKEDGEKIEVEAKGDEEAKEPTDALS